MHTKNISGSFGVEVTDIDLSKRATKEDANTLVNLLVEKKVIVVKN